MSHRDEPWVAIVDDDCSLRVALSRVLRVEGIEVGAFGTAQDYLAASESGTSPSCLVLDAYLGAHSHMSGFALRDFLDASGARVPTILMTAHDEVLAKELEHRCNADNYLAKPFDSDVLIELIQRAIRSGASGG